MLTWSVLMTSYKPHRLVRVVFDRLRHDQDPPTREQHVDGATRMVKSYGEADLDIIDQAIVLIMEPPSQLPPATDS